MSQAWNSWYADHLEQQRLRHLTTKAMSMWRNRVSVTKCGRPECLCGWWVCACVWSSLSVWVRGCVGAWVTCWSECLCLLHVDTYRCIVAHDSRKQHWHCTKLHVCGPCVCVSVCVPISIADTHATLHLRQNSICIFIYASGTKQQHALQHESDDGQTRRPCHKPGIPGTQTTWSSSA